jgi:membrane-associated phospholipid phosphatase
MDSTVRDTLGDAEAGAAYDDLYQALGEPNSVAAMPSIHMAITFGMFLWAWRFARRLAPWLLAYTGLMGLALAYLGEHYVADELAGMAIAAVAWGVVLRVPALRPSQAAR